MTQGEITQERFNRAVEDSSIAETGRLNAEEKLALCVEALEATQDLLFGLLDYFEPGHELDQIHAQRDGNRAAITAARSQA